MGAPIVLNALEDEEIRSHLVPGAESAPASGELKGLTFILDSEDSKKDGVTMSEAE